MSLRSIISGFFKSSPSDSVKKKTDFQEESLTSCRIDNSVSLLGDKHVIICGYGGAGKTFLTINHLGKNPDKSIYYVGVGFTEGQDEFTPIVVDTKGDSVGRIPTNGEIQDKAHSDIVKLVGKARASKEFIFYRKGMDDDLEINRLFGEFKIVNVDYRLFEEHDLFPMIYDKIDLLKDTGASIVIDHEMLFEWHTMESLLDHASKNRVQIIWTAASAYHYMNILNSFPIKVFFTDSNSVNDYTYIKQLSNSFYYADLVKATPARFTGIIVDEANKSKTITQFSLARGDQ